MKKKEEIKRRIRKIMINISKNLIKNMLMRLKTETLLLECQKVYYQFRYEYGILSQILNGLRVIEYIVHINLIHQES